MNFTNKTNSMRSIVFFLVIILTPFLFTAQTANKQEPKPFFVVLYTIGAKWDTAKDFEEQPYAKEHSAYLAKLRKEKVITLGGRYADTGMIIFKAANEEKAKELIRTDEAVKNGLFKAEVYVFDPFYGGCVQ